MLPAPSCQDGLKGTRFRKIEAGLGEALERKAVRIPGALEIRARIPQLPSVFFRIVSAATLMAVLYEHTIAGA